MEQLKHFILPIAESGIILICVIKNEHLLLEYFIKHYSKIGVTHFIFIDNYSTDESVKYLLDHNANIMLYQTNESFKLNKTNWVNHILTTYCKNKWVALVDADELIYMDDLNALKNSMENEKANVCNFYLLDMYPKNYDKQYVKGESFLNHSNYYDKESKINMNDASGVRKRCLNTIVCLRKKSFFKYTFSCCNKIDQGYHFLTRFGPHDCVRYYKIPQIVLHFKFIKHDLKGFFKQCIAENQYYENSIEYKNYHKAENYNFFDPTYSLCIDDVKPNFSFI